MRPLREISVRYRNRIIRAAYKGVLRPIFFMNDPESMHDQVTSAGRWLGHHPMARGLTRWLFGYGNERLHQNILGIVFKNPLGLAAGFDKNAELTDILPAIGFGFAEVGSVTGYPCSGNPKPRLWRLPKSQSLVVHYGLKNDGCEAISAKLRGAAFGIPIGMSIAMTNRRENLDLESAVTDYAKAFRAMEPFGAYVTVNVSCPNVHGGQPFVVPHKLDRLFDILDEIPTIKPVFIKISPDLDDFELDAFLGVARRHRIHGIICTNLTKKRDRSRIIDADVPDIGGLSGKVVQDMSDDMLARIYKKEGGRFVLIGCGGVSTAEDAYKKIRLGASLIQMITGMIFEGPQVVSEINQGLEKLLEHDGFKTITDAIGVDNC